jgi:hypothetical protein
VCGGWRECWDKERLFLIPWGTTDHWAHCCFWVHTDWLLCPFVQWLTMTPPRGSWFLWRVTLGKPPATHSPSSASHQWACWIQCLIAGVLYLRQQAVRG